MKTNVYITYLSIATAFISFLLSLLVQFLPLRCISAETQEYMVAILISVFASALLVFPVSIINYFYERKRALENLYLKIERYYIFLNQYCFKRNDGEKEQFIKEVKIKYNENYIYEVRNNLFCIYFMFSNRKKFNKIRSSIYMPFHELFNKILDSESKDEFEAAIDFPNISDESKLCVCSFPKRMQLEKAKKDFYYKYMYGYISYQKAIKEEKK